jgi:hypothetical protein
MIGFFGFRIAKKRMLSPLTLRTRVRIAFVFIVLA